MTTVDEPARAAARFFNAYARRYSAGAFATPTAAELSRIAAAGGLHAWTSLGGAAGAVERRLGRDSGRLDFTGTVYSLRAGTRLITHLAADAAATLPDLGEFDWVYTYVEDANVTTQLQAQGREVRAVRVSAASEIIACWGRAGTGAAYPAVEAATLVELPLGVTRADRGRILDEVKALDSWHDDFPYYSDGSWGAINLRGFNPADPTWGIKPAEMSKSWWAEHPEAKAYGQCDWTVAAQWCPTVVNLVKGVPWWGDLERVRLLRMAGRDGKGGSLARHTDVTDRAAGTRNGQIARFHIPLVTDPRITMTAWNIHGRQVSAHLPQWSMWYLDARKPHAVDNRAGIDRIHLVVDVVADSQVRQAITAGREVAR